MRLNLPLMRSLNSLDLHSRDVDLLNVSSCTINSPVDVVYVLSLDIPRLEELSA
jgi:hypothetical protein